MADRRDKITNNRANAQRLLAASTRDEQTCQEAFSAEHPQQETKQRKRYTRRIVLGGLAAVVGGGLTATVATGCSNGLGSVATAATLVTTQPRSPFNVYTDGGDSGNHYAASGFMGDYEAIKLTENWEKYPHSGKTCIQVVYSGILAQGKGWAGVYWQQPKGNWGTVSPVHSPGPTGYDLSHYTKLSFWVRGELGNEHIQFLVGGIGGVGAMIPVPYPDSLQPAIRTPVITLTTGWQPQTISLKGGNLTHVIGGFGWIVNNTDSPKGATFYLDDIVYSS